VHFRELYRQHFGEEPSNVTGFGYDAADVLIEGLKRSKTWTPSALKDTILRIKHFRSVFGDFEFDAYGDTWRPSVIVTVQNGKFVRAP
jgi:branched-chain amino acid transport system substrate-binding protein